MAINNSVTLIGNMGDEVQIIENDTITFASVSLATADSYKDDNENWQEAATIWHRVLAFNPRVIAALKNLKKGSRIAIEGALSYRPRKISVVDKQGEVKEFDIQEASIVARKIELAPLPKKSG